MSNIYVFYFNEILMRLPCANGEFACLEEQFFYFCAFVDFNVNKAFCIAKYLGCC